jgi:uncharacterized caspase-like protein
MRRIYISVVSAVVLLFAWAATAQQSEKRIALVIGNGAYQAEALPTAANDAGLIAQTLQASGFDVVGARDLDQDTLRRSFRDFLEKATGSGPDTVAFVYFAGYGLQLEGENYLVPTDARIGRDTDVAASAMRVSDYLRPLAALKLKTTIVVLDAAHPNPFARSGPPLAGGLALIEPEPGLLVAYNAAPGTVAPAGSGPYGAYAQALAEMMRDGGLPLTDVFDRVRLRVNDVTKGAEVPWHASRVQGPFVFFERAPDAPPPVASAEQTQAMRAQPIRDLGPQEAYAAALERDTLQGYVDFIAAYPADPMAKRVRAIVAARREAITWRRTRLIDTPNAYWSYLRRYPHGPHAADARRRLAFLSVALEPPPAFDVVTYDVPPPPPEEIIYVERPVLTFDDPVYAFEPPPPPPVFFLPPPPPEFVVLAPPPPPFGVFLLPIPVYTPVPIWVRPPVYVARPPPNNIIFQNVHNTVVVNNINTVTITEPSGQARTVTPATSQQPAQTTPGRQIAPAAALGPALPPSVAEKARTIPATTQQGSGTPGEPSQAGQPPTGRQVPGTAGKPLPVPGAPVTGVQPNQQQQQTGQPPTGRQVPETAGKPQPTPGAPVTGTQPNQPQPNQVQIQQQRQQQIQQQRQQQVEQQRQQQIQQQRQQQVEQQRQQQIQQQRQQQIQQQRQQQVQQQQIQQQRQQQVEQQRQQQIQQQRQQQVEQQRQQQIQQQRQQQVEQQRQQQIQQQRQQQVQQQQIQQQRQQQVQQQRQASPHGPAKQPPCGGQGQPPCPR